MAKPTGCQSYHTYSKREWTKRGIVERHRKRDRNRRKSAREREKCRLKTRRSLDHHRPH